MTITKEGALASFYTVNKAPIKHLRVYFSPKQAGSGTASPENIRPIEGRSNIYADCTGQNLLPSGTFAVTRRGIDYQYSIDGSIRIQGYDASYTFLSLPSDYQFYIPAGTYTLSCNTSSGITVYMLLDGNDIEFKIGNGKTSITKTIPSGIAKLQVAAYTTVDTTIYPQLEVGSIASSFKKPMIHRPQTIQFPPQTKNLFNPNWDMLNYTSTYTINSDGSITQKQSDGRGWTQSNFPPIHLEAGTYTLTCSDGNTFNVGTSIDNFATQTRLANGGGTFTLAQDADVRIKHSASSYPTTFTAQLEKGSSATSYEPYMDTIYGGYVDLVTGELVQEYNCYQFTGNETFYDQGNTWVTVFIPDIKTNSSIASNPAIGICSHYPYHPYNRGKIGVMYNEKGCTFDGNIKNNIEWQQYCAEQYALNTPVTICYKLKTSITHQLTPIQLQTFIGRNNIWSNADRIEVEYDLAESNDELYRRRNILLQGAPHLETATGNVANFKTDLVAPIKEAKVYFEPIQVGSGTPSLENVREIVGYTGCEVSYGGKNLLDKDTYFTKPYNGKFIWSSTGAQQYWSSAYSASEYIPIKGNQKYTLHAAFYSQDNGGLAFYDENKIYISGIAMNSTTIETYTFTTPINAKYLRFSCIIDNSWNITFNPEYVALEAGDGTQGYENYNAQTISCSFPAVGKNLLDITRTEKINPGARTSNITISNGIISIDAVAGSARSYVMFEQNFPAGTYTIQVQHSGAVSMPKLLATSEFDGSSYNSYYVAYTRQISITTNSLTFTLPQTSKLGIVLPNATNESGDPGTIYDIQVESGSVKTAYEPYTNTIYGGYIDLTTGGIYKTHDKIMLSENMKWWGSWGTKLKYCTFYMSGSTSGGITHPRRKANTTIYCNELTSIGNLDPQRVTSLTEIRYYGPDPRYPQYLYMANPDELSDAEWRVWFTETHPNAYIVYEFETPQYITTLTPTQLKTLKGTNNIWSSANGPISIKYWTH